MFCSGGKLTKYCTVGINMELGTPAFGPTLNDGYGKRICSDVTKDVEKFQSLQN